VHYLGSSLGNRPFELHFTDGGSERVSRAVVLQGLVPIGAATAGSALVNDDRVPVALAAPADVGRLPARFDLSTEAAVRVALQMLCPGHWPAGHLAAIAAQAGTTPWHGAELSAQLYGHLLSILDLSRVTSWVVPWAQPVSTVSTTLASVQPTIRAQILQQPLDALHPGTYRELAKQRRLQYALVLAPDPLCDVIGPLCAMFTTMLACLLVPVTYVTHGPMGRKAHLRRLLKEKRLLLILGPGTLPGDVQMCWVCVFGNEALVHQHVHSVYLPVLAEGLRSLNIALRQA
jgi:hypothetical protein